MKNSTRKDYINFIKLLFQGIWLTLIVLLLLDALGGSSPIIVAWINAELIDHIAYPDSDKSLFMGIGTQTYIILVVFSLISFLTILALQRFVR
jgi:hypothetical protein